MQFVTKLGWLHSAMAGIHSACVLARRAKTHPPTIQTSGQLNLMIQQSGRLACPNTHATESAHSSTQADGRQGILGMDVKVNMSSLTG
jgi:hypothetical protein